MSSNREAIKSRIRLGGVKVVEKRACLYSFSTMEADLLGIICSTLATQRINIGLLTHVADNGFGESITVASAKNDLCFSGCMLDPAGLRGCKTGEIESEVSRISIFPHDRNPEIAASVMTIFGTRVIKLRAIASSPSAVTIIVSLSEFKAAMERLFDSFSFPACDSYQQWQSVYRMDEQQLSEVRFSYSERIITTYGFTRQTGLDLWNVSISTGRMSDFGTLLSELGKLGFKLPFLISTSAPGEKITYFSLTLEQDRRETARQVYDKLLPGSSVFCCGPVSVLFVHGPHFGDRYGIAHAFVTALRNGSIPLMALSCAVSSISAVIAENDHDRAIEVLSSRFQTPRGKSS